MYQNAPKCAICHFKSYYSSCIFEDKKAHIHGILAKHNEFF